MSQTSFRCPNPNCKQTYPVPVKDLGKLLHCKRCDHRFRLDRLDEYVLLDVLGDGAFGVVYRAYDLHNCREVALKQLKEKAVPEHEFESWVKRAELEARALAKIDFHPNVLPLYTSGYVGRKFFMVTPVIRGQTLDATIPKGGFPDPTRAVELAITILRALYHIHAFKVYHRDVKPSNIMIDGNGNLYLVDFGLASCRQLGIAMHTEMGTMLGTPAYMPTEQARGEINRVGPWSDQYGAGAVLFRMLTGGVPYSGANVYAVVAQVGDYNTPPTPPRHFRPNLDAELEELVLRSLRKFPGERFDSCAEFADVLQAWVDRRKKRPSPPPEVGPIPTTTTPEGVQAPPPFAPAARPRASTRVPWWAVLVVVAALLTAGGVLTWKWVTAAKPPAAIHWLPPSDKKPSTP